MGYGFEGHIGLAKESTFGTAVAATDYIKALSEGLITNIERFDTVNVHGSFAEPDDSPGVKRAEGDLVFAGHPVSIGYALKSCFVQNSVTVVLSGFLFRNTFVTPTADFAAVCAGQPYTFEIFRGVTSSHRYAGAVVNQLQLGYAPNQDLRVTASIIAKATSIIAKTTPTFPGSPAKPFTFDTASVQLAGAATVRMEALNITIDNQLEGVPVLNNSDEVAKILRRGPQMVNISGTLDFADVAEYLDFLNQTERQIKVSTFKANSFGMVVDIPRMVYTAFPVGIAGRERITVDFEGKGFYHSGSGTAIDIQLTTVKSNY